MINSICSKLHEKANILVLVFSFFIFLSFVLFILPGESERSNEYFGGSQVPDTSFIYTGDDLHNMAREFGPGGRDYYIRSRLTFDVVWPVAYGFFLWAAIGNLGKPLKDSAFKFIVLLPFSGVILDYLENAGASVVMFFYPDRIFLLNEIVPVFTFLKWIVIGISFFVIIILIAYRFIFLIRYSFH